MWLEGLPMKRVRTIVVRNRPWPAFLLASLAMAPANQAHAAGLTIQDWSLGAQVNTWPPGATETTASFEPETPFQTTHLATLDSSWTQADYAIAYSGTLGSFLIESTQNALGGPFGTSATTQASGAVFFTTDAPLSISVDAEYTYDLPPVSMFAQLAFVVRLADDPTVVVFGSSQSDNSFTGEGAAGTFTLSETTVLPAGQAYLLRYDMEISTSGGSIITFGTGAGHVDFTMEVLPEPATAMLLLCALPLLRHRRRNTDESS